MDEIYTTTSAVRTLPTVNEMLEIAEQLRALTPACWHYDLVTSEFLPTHKDGIVYACVKCLKKFVAPRSLFGDTDPPKWLHIDPFAGKLPMLGASE